MFSWWFKCIKTHDTRVRDLVGSTNRESRDVTEADTTSIEPSAFGVHNENSADIWSIYIYLLTHGLCYAVHVRKYILLANMCNEYACQSLQLQAHLKYELLLNSMAIWYQRIEWTYQKSFLVV